MPVTQPCAVNKFDTEEQAREHARQWSKDFRETWTIIHGPTESEGLKYFVEKGDGGMIRSTERKAATYTRGKENTEA